MKKKYWTKCQICLRNGIWAAPCVKSSLVDENTAFSQRSGLWWLMLTVD